MTEFSEALRTELDSAIRAGLRDAGVKGTLYQIVGPVLDRIERALTTMRCGTSAAFIDDKVVGADVIISAQALVARRRAER